MDEKIRQVDALLSQLGFENEIRQRLDVIMDVIDEVTPKVASIVEMSDAEIKSYLLSSVVLGYIFHVGHRYGIEFGKQVWMLVAKTLNSPDEILSMMNYLDEVLGDDY